MDATFAKHDVIKDPFTQRTTLSYVVYDTYFYHFCLQRQLFDISGKHSFDNFGKRELIKNTNEYRSTLMILQERIFKNYLTSTQKMRKKRDNLNMHL